MKIAFAVFWLGVALEGQGRAQSPDSAVLQALLSEVHQLRIAIERSNTYVTRISAQLEGVRHDSDRVQSDGARFSESIKNYESEPQVERVQRLEQGLHSQEADLGSRLGSAQATLDGLNDRLNQIERALDTTPQQ